ncbi:MAG: tetratricopeptide repeat protein [Candidatus Krumholzibacteriota bacterium]|nr:tetratricopeptide repeat protein [Candidatus Krumholzibacteriota bacterium]
MSRIQEMKRQLSLAMQQSDWEEALSILGKMVSQDAQPAYFNQLGDIYLKTGRRDEAIASFMEGVKGYRNLGMYPNGAALCKKVLRLEPELREAVWLLGELKSRQGFLADGAEGMLEALHYYADDPNTDRNEFARMLAEAEQLHAANLKVLEFAATAYAQAGDMDQARIVTLRIADLVEDREGDAGKARQLREAAEHLTPGVSPAAGLATPAPEDAAAAEAGPGIDADPANVAGEAEALAPEPETAPETPAASGTSRQRALEDTGPYMGGMPGIPEAGAGGLSLAGGIPGLTDGMGSGPQIWDITETPPARDEAPETRASDTQAPETAGPDAASGEPDGVAMDAADATDPGFEAGRDEGHDEGHDEETGGLPVADEAAPDAGEEAPAPGDEGRGETIEAASDGAMEEAPGDGGPSDGDDDFLLRPAGVAAPPDAADHVGAAMDGGADVDAGASIDAAAEGGDGQPADEDFVADGFAEAPAVADLADGAEAGEPDEDGSKVWEIGEVEAKLSEIEALDLSNLDVAADNDEVVPDDAGDSPRQVERVLGEFRERMEEQLGPMALEERYQLGVAYMEMGLHEEALVEFDQILKHSFISPKTRELMARCLLALGRADEVLPLLESVLNDEPHPRRTSIELYYLLGEAYDRMGQKDHALDSFNKVYQLEPDFRDVQRKLENLTLSR